MRGLRRASPLGTALGQGVLDAAQRTERFQGAHREHGAVTAWRWHLRAIHKGAMELPVALPIGANPRGQWLWSDAMGCHGHSQLWALLLGTKKERDIHWELKQQPYPCRLEAVRRHRVQSACLGIRGRNKDTGTAAGCTMSPQCTAGLWG